MTKNKLPLDLQDWVAILGALLIVTGVYAKWGLGSGLIVGGVIVLGAAILDAIYDARQKEPS